MNNKQTKGLLDIIEQLNALKNSESVIGDNSGIPLETKTNAKDYEGRLGNLEYKSTSMQNWFIGVIIGLAIAIIGLIIGIVIDYSKLNRYMDTKDELERQLRNYEREFSKLQYQIDNIYKYIDSKIEAEISMKVLDLYKDIKY